MRAMGAKIRSEKLSDVIFELSLIVTHFDVNLFLVLDS